MFLSAATRFLETNSVEKAKQHVKELYVTAYLADWVYWPFFQAINFYFVPPSLRITYLSVTTLAWNAFLCYLDLSDVSFALYLNFL